MALYARDGEGNASIHLREGDFLALRNEGNASYGFIKTYGYGHLMDGRQVLDNERAAAAYRAPVGSVEYIAFFLRLEGQAGASCVPVVPGNVGVTERFELAMGEEKTGMNVGGIVPGRIGETVWQDSNGNGLQDYKEPLLSGVTLKLLKQEADGQLHESAQATSDEYGYYWFESLRPGTYVLTAEMGEGDTLTFSFGDPLQEIDSDIDPDTGMSSPIMLQSGQTIRSIDVGFTDYTSK